MQAGVEYIRNISTFVKNGINSLKDASFSITSEGLQLVPNLFLHRFYLVFAPKHALNFVSFLGDAWVYDSPHIPKDKNGPIGKHAGKTRIRVFQEFPV